MTNSQVRSPNEPRQGSASILSGARIVADRTAAGRPAPLTPDAEFRPTKWTAGSDPDIQRQLASKHARTSGETGPNKLDRSRPRLVPSRVRARPGRRPSARARRPRRS